MQKQKSLKFFVAVCVVLMIDVPLISAARHKQGKTTTRATQAPAPTQAPQNDNSKLSYGNQGPPAPHNPPPPAYQPYGQSGGHAPPPYSQNPPPYQSQPGYHQPAPAQQPIIVNHVQQPQSSGGLGTAGGLAVGALAGAAGGYALSKALEGDDKKDESTTTTAASTTTVSGATTTTTIAGSSSTTVSGASTDSTTPTIFVTTIASNETTTLNPNLNDTTTLNPNSNDTTMSSTSNDSTTSSSPSTMAPVTEALVEQKNSTSSNQAPGNDGIIAKISLNIALLSLICRFIF